MKDFFQNLGSRIRSSMIGRYGNDELNRFLFGVAIVLMLVSMFVRNPAAYSILSLLVTVLLVLCIVRLFSRNIAKRYQENQKFMQGTVKIRSFFKDTWYSITHWKEERARNQGYHIYRCPRCHQKIRVPKGKGHIIITCPKCRFEFHKKS